MASIRSKTKAPRPHPLGIPHKVSVGASLAWTEPALLRLLETSLPLKCTHIPRVGQEARQMHQKIVTVLHSNADAI